ncbi:hypothetical protein [Bradyrhizobium canariense]|uniref:hypothetical protein n=1 Tax=Bradyrhizobium canariense TaxID=255045 RepID=UPI001178AA7C|nr:hypothetical protein [Bradyrhizobium canariense]
MGVANIKGGYIIPDKDTVLEILKNLKADMDKDPQLQADFHLNPGAVLGARGVSVPVQRDVFRGEKIYGHQQADCSLSCIHTDSCVLSTGCH